MTKEDKASRPYRSPRRAEQANRTRHAITEAARRLFLQHGYAGATIGAIAEEAGVAAETVYAIFGSKRALLAHLVEVSVVGDDRSTPLLQRDFVKATEAEPNQREQIRMFAGQMRDIMTRMAPIFDVLRAAAKTEPEIAALRAEILANRRRGMLHFVRAVAAHGPLRAGLTPEEAADIVFALSSGEMFAVLTGDLGWSGEAFTVWLAQALTAALLP